MFDHRESRAASLDESSGRFFPIEVRLLVLVLLARRVFGGFLLGLSSVLALACSGTGSDRPPVPEGVTPVELTVILEPGDLVETRRLFTAEETLAAADQAVIGRRPTSAERDGAPTDRSGSSGRSTAASPSAEAAEAVTIQAWREDVYVTEIEQVDPRGAPVAATRTYERALFRLLGPQGEREGSSAVAGQTIRFRPGLPPQVAGEPLPEAVAVGLRLRPFDELLLPPWAAWEGATWSPTDEALEELARFLREIGLRPDQNELSVTWTSTRWADSSRAALPDPGPPMRGKVAELTIQWRATGLLQRGAGQISAARMQIDGTARYDFDQRLITALSLRGYEPASGSSFRIELNRNRLDSGVSSATRVTRVSPSGEAQPEPAD